MFPHYDPQECSVNVNYAGRKGHSFAKPWSIFRVLALLCNVDNEAYTSKMISIRPFHRHCAKLKYMEAQKLQLLDQLLQRLCCNNITKEAFLGAMKSEKQHSKLDALVGTIPRAKKDQNFHLQDDGARNNAVKWMHWSALYREEKGIKISIYKMTEWRYAIELGSFPLQTSLILVNAQPYWDLQISNR
ncbi:Protein of unknown function DUF247, plant [Dillenia turbinata]|uniref:Uncharacterized protein n=1 Tax=Dillenia turbinata TaxID=194707 RepID=A0AAN8ZPT2_9MAGN